MVEPRDAAWLRIDAAYLDPTGREQQIACGIGPGITALAAEAPAALFEAVVGLRPLSRGSVRIDGAVVAAVGGRPRPAAGVAWLPDPPALAGEWSVRRNLRVGARVRGGVRSAAGFGAVVEALDLAAVLDAAVATLPLRIARRVQLGRALLAGARALLVEVAPGTPPAERRELLAGLRWASDARGLAVLHAAWSTADLDDGAEQLTVLQDGRSHGPAEPFELLGRTLRGALAERFAVESVLDAVVDYLDEEGRWLRVLVGGHEVHLPFVRLSPGWRGRVAIGPDRVLLANEPLRGPRLTNQLPGRVVALGDLCGRARVDVAIAPGRVLRALVEPDTVREQGFAPGRDVVAIFEPAAVRWLG